MTYLPHGTASGQIGHNSNIDLNDTPGSTGGKFVGFGEDGTSANANRAHWFLSQNIDHVYQEVHREIAITKGYDRTSPGGGEASFQFPAGEDIWVGDTTYPGSAGTSDPEGMQMLFNVVDANYNELTDGADNEIRVKRVRESTGVTDIYQGGFDAEPIIYFVAVDPATGAEVTEPYTIPAATEYKVLCGIKSTVAEMPADALIRFKVQASTEVEAGMLLQDGTRPMTGDLDLDGNNIVNVDVVSNVTSEPLDITSDNELLFKDQHLTAGLALSESGQAALYQPVDALVYPSLVGAVNSGVEAQEFMQGDRSMDRTGSFTTASAPALTYPAIAVSLQGQILHFASDTVTASGGGDGQYFLYVTLAGVVTFAKHANWAAAPAGAIPLWTGELTGSETSWDGPIDLRWAGTSGKHNAIYVGTGVGADFASLNDAANWLVVTAYGTEDTNVNCEIIVVGEATVSETFYLYSGWTLRGVSPRGVNIAADSEVITTSTFAVGSHVIDAGEYTIVKDLRLKWGNTSADQNTAYAALYVKHGCTVENVLIDKDTAAYRFGNGVKAINGGTMSGAIIRDCTFSYFTTAGIVATGVAHIHVENCTFYTQGAANPAYHIDFSASGATGASTGPGHTVSGCHFIGKPTTANIEVGGPHVLVDSCHGELSTGAATSAFITIVSGHVNQDKAGVTVRNCLLESGNIFIDATITNVGMRMTVLVEGCSCYAFTGTIFDFNCAAQVDGASVTTIRDCNIDGQSSAAAYIGYFVNAKGVNFIHNRVIDGAGYGLYVGANTQANIDGNYINGWKVGSAINFVAAAWCRVVNNFFQYTGVAGVTGIALSASFRITIANNDLFGDGTYAEVGILIDSGRYNSINNNRLSNWLLYCVHISADSDTANYNWIVNNYFEGGGSKTITVGAITDVAASAIFIDGGNAAEYLVITGNTFKALSGSAIRSMEDYSRARTIVSDNIFTGVKGRYLYDSDPGGTPTPELDRFAVIALEFGGDWTISGNTFSECGDLSDTIQGVAIRAHAICLNTTEPVIISNNAFSDSYSAGSTDVDDHWSDIGIYGATGDVICNNNSFYRDITNGASFPYNGFAQIYKYGDGSLIISGCLFQLIGTTTGTLEGASTCQCVYTLGGSVHATGCFTKGTFDSGSSSDYLWDLDSANGAVVGCVFDGAHDVDIFQAGGFNVGNIHLNSGGSAGLTVGGYPTSDTYGTLATADTESPLSVLNKEV